jgi:hypothetical protein
MLRALVLLFLLVNVALYFWLQSDALTLQSDREPQRLGRQVSPDSVQVLPDLPAASGARRAASAASPVSLAASGPDVALAGTTGAQAPASAATLALVHKTSETGVDCSETPGLDDAQFTALKTALAKGGVPSDAIAERRQSQGGAWIVYLGRFADAQTWQQKADELRKLDVKFDRVNTPTALAPGLSLGQFTNQSDATKKLDDVTKHGVHSARIVTLTAPTVVRHLQVRAVDPAWHHAAGAQRFNSCLLDAASNT